MSLFNNQKDIQIGDSVFMEYGEHEKALGTCVNIIDELIEVDYTTENSTEQKTDKFRKGLWKK